MTFMKQENLLLYIYIYILTLSATHSTQPRTEIRSWNHSRSNHSSVVSTNSKVTKKNAKFVVKGMYVDPTDRIQTCNAVSHQALNHMDKKVFCTRELSAQCSILEVSANDHHHAITLFRKTLIFPVNLLTRTTRAQSAASNFPSSECKQRFHFGNSVIQELWRPPLAPSIFFCFSNHQGSVLFFFLILSLPLSVFQWHHEKGNFFSEYDQSNWLFYVGYYLEMFSSIFYVQERYQSLLACQ